MSRSSARGQVEPVAALVVLVAVCVAVSTYAAAVDGAIGEEERSVAPPTLDRVVDILASGGVAKPDRTDRARRAGPAGYRLNVTAAAAGQRWHTGPTPPEAVDTETATRRIGIQIGPARVRPGRVRVEVWA
ncbi:DUF7285 family protein [Haloplanus salilacus]|uniref:DUF7285 family protein n=1 Tax=Haloplanus salilacus TaxID=2949994 RepID=UPI0030D56D47